MDMGQKKFEPFERVLVRNPKDKYPEWTCDMYSHISDNGDLICVGNYFEAGEYEILPFAGNETLVGTKYLPEEVVELKDGEMIVAFSSKDALAYMDFSLCSFWEIQDDAIKTNTSSLFKFCIPFSKFNPNDIEETRKHILCVKNGKLVRARV